MQQRSIYACEEVVLDQGFRITKHQQWQEDKNNILTTLRASIYVNTSAVCQEVGSAEKNNNSPHILFMTLHIIILVTLIQSKYTREQNKIFSASVFIVFIFINFCQVCDINLLNIVQMFQRKDKRDNDDDGGDDQEETGKPTLASLWSCMDYGETFPISKSHHLSLNTI